MRLLLSRATPEDFDQMIEVAVQSFKEDPMTPIFFGHGDKRSYAHLKKQWMKGTEDATCVWYKLEDGDSIVDVVMRDESGKPSGTEKRTKILAGCNWFIYGTYVPPKEDDASGPPKEVTYLDDEQERKDAEKILADFTARRNADSQEPHVLCSLLFVHPDHVRQGLGKIMMQWGIDLADAMMLPCWLEASSKGEGLYRKLGYEVTYRGSVENKTFPGSELIRMRRPQKEAKREVRVVS
jgi:GNAT superfamily N-acetyltransferase